MITRILTRAEIIFPLGGLVDLAAERARLAREIEESEGHLRRVEGKLANQSFRSKAPAAVVTREEERYAAIVGRLDGLRARLAELP